MPHGINSRLLTKQNPFTNEGARAVGKRFLFMLVARRHAKHVVNYELLYEPESSMNYESVSA